MNAIHLLTALTLGCSIVACSTTKSSTSAAPEELTKEPTTVRAGLPKPIDWSAFDSTSIRNPNDGSLHGGVPLPLAAPGLRFNPTRDAAARYGTLEVVRALVDAAARVDRELGGLPVTINDLSLETGGPLPRHRSHQSGRDVDVLFYQLDENGRPIESVGAFFDPSGEGVDFNDLATPEDDVRLRLDVPRTWLFVQALIESEHAQLQNIYVAEHIRTLLLLHARSIGVAATTLARFEALTCQPTYPHDDHFHFRFFCTADDIEAGCRDSKPIYPWQRERLKDAGVKPLPLAPKRAEATTEIVTHEEARRSAGPMDAEVERWLDLRTQWLKKPHPGRTYCP
jgi:penicillin-insensitive murein endopeptidase